MLKGVQHDNKNIMFYFVLLLFEISVLFFLSRAMSKTLSKFLSINILSFLFLPGVIIHELSHLLIAAILLVPVGHMEFAPKKSSSGLKLGSVEIGKTDPIRRAIIGFAPVFAGIALILGLIYFVADSNLIVQTIELSMLSGIGFIAFMLYLLFVVSNTMFSSKTDMEGTLEILITFFIIFLTAYILGFRPQLDFAQNLFTEQIVGLLQKSTLFLSAPIAIDIVLLGLIRAFKK